MNDKPTERIAKHLDSISTWLCIIAICQVITCNGCNTPAKADPIPNCMRYCLENWLHGHEDRNEGGCNGIGFAVAANSNCYLDRTPVLNQIIAEADRWLCTE